MSGTLDLDAIEAQARHWDSLVRDDPDTTLALVAEVRRLRRWKDESLPVMAGLQEVGHALGLPLGASITGREAVDAALDLRNRAEAAEVYRGTPERSAEEGAS